MAESKLPRTLTHEHASQPEAPKTRDEEVQAAVETQGTDTLPPAGHWRKEALIRRQAQLEQQIEEKANQMLVGAIDASKMDIDPEIAFGAQDHSVIGNHKSDYHYTWVEWNERLPSDHGQHMEAARSMGYEPVRATDEDGRSAGDRFRITPEGWIRWGSCIYMRISRQRYITVMAMRRAEQMSRRGDEMNATRLVELGDRYGVKVHTNLPEDVMQRARQQHESQKRIAAIRLNNPFASAAIDRNLRNAHLG